MIEYRKGNLLSVTDGVIAHGVNCQGVMGAGVAKAIKDKYPVVYAHYQALCDNEMDQPWRLLGSVKFVPSVEPIPQKSNPLVIAHCFTQVSYGRDKRHVDYEAVAKCLSTLNERVKMYTDSALNIPKIGAGLAGGDWKVISAIIESEYKGDVICWEL